jgi:hypothetical protein
MVRITLDGEEVKWCSEADDELGFVVAEEIVGKTIKPVLRTGVVVVSFPEAEQEI